MQVVTVNEIRIIWCQLQQAPRARERKVFNATLSPQPATRLTDPTQRVLDATGHHVSCHSVVEAGRNNADLGPRLALRHSIWKLQAILSPRPVCFVWWRWWEFIKGWTAYSIFVVPKCGYFGFCRMGQGSSLAIIPAIQRALSTFELESLNCIWPQQLFGTKLLDLDLDRAQ